MTWVKQPINFHISRPDYKHRLLMKFGQFMSHYKSKNFIKNSTKPAAWKLVPGLFVFAKNLEKLLAENEILEASFLY